MRQKIFLLTALLCAVAQGAWAQNYGVWDGTTTTRLSPSVMRFLPAMTSGPDKPLTRIHTSGGATPPAVTTEETLVKQIIISL